MDLALRIVGLTKRFAGVAAVDALDLEVVRGHIHAVIGPNGAGKTTLFNLVSGFVLPDAGTVMLDGRDIGALPTHLRTAAGLVRTFQNIRLFGGLTVLENVLVGQHHVARPGLGSLWPARSASDRALRRKADDLIELFGLDRYRQRRASELPYGYQKRLEMARAMAGEPRVLLLDEPTAGMNPNESDEILDEILAIRDRGVTVLLVEHDMNVVMEASDRVTVLNFGRKIAEGDPTSIQDDPAVQVAYLGQ
jgi:branched-chain amino acid transport system ATP-binding protein